RRNGRRAEAWHRMERRPRPGPFASRPRLRRVRGSGLPGAIELRTAMLQLPEAGPDTLIADTLGAGGFGVYIHWPFCAAKCPYCDFNSHVRHQDIDEPRFAAALVRELRTLAERVPGRRVDSIFLGGGTPSLMAPRTVATVLEAIARLWPLAEDVEV